MIHTTTNTEGARNVRALRMAELDRAKICGRIQEARLEAGLSQEEMAEAMNVGDRTYQNYEYNRVPWGRLGEIETLTGKSKEWLLHGHENIMGTLKPETLTGHLARLEGELVALREQVSQLVALLGSVVGDLTHEADVERAPRPERRRKHGTAGEIPSTGDRRRAG